MEEIKKQTSGDLVPVAIISYIDAMEASVLQFANESQKDSAINATIRVISTPSPLNSSQNVLK